MSRYHYRLNIFYPVYIADNSIGSAIYRIHKLAVKYEQFSSSQIEKAKAILDKPKFVSLLNYLAPSLQSIMMTKYNPKKQTALDRLYYSFSLDFWLILANILAVANWMLDSQNTPNLLLLPGVAIASALAFVNKNRHNQVEFRNFINRYKLTGILTLSLALMTLVTVFNFATSPSHAFIVNETGVDVFKKLFTAGDASNANGGLASFASTIVIALRVAFFMAFVGVLVNVAEELKNRSEWTEVVKMPIIFAVVLGAVEIVAGMLLKAPA